MNVKHLWGLVLALLLATGPAAAIENRLGLGVHLWRTAGEVRDDLIGGEKSDLSGLLSYQLVLFRPLKLEADLEFFPNGFGGSGEEAWSPQGLIVVGDRLYAAVGAGVVYSTDLEGSFSEVSYIARLGADLPLCSRLRLDLSADHRAGEVDQLMDVDADAVTFALVLRVVL